MDLSWCHSPEWMSSYEPMLVLKNFGSEAKLV